MRTELPDFVDCGNLAVARGGLAGSIAPQRLARVTGVYRAAGVAAVNLAFAHDDRGRVIIHGALAALVEAQCQRCLEWMPLSIDTSIGVVALEPGDLVAGENQDDDVVIAPGGRLNVLDLIEDEILLACPMIPGHAEQCSENGPACRADGSANINRPFEGLAELLEKRR